MAAQGCYGAACITALTVQSTSGVRRVEGVAAGLVAETLRELASDLNITAVHVGMLGTGEVAGAVADFLTEGRFSSVVLDPILRSSSGASLLDEEGVRVLTGRLFPLATVITPNIQEAASLTGLEVAGVPEMRAAAAKLHSMGAAAVVVTGGHLDPSVDLLSVSRPDGAEQQLFKSGQQQSSSTHGTGCAFATAMACHLAKGRALPEAVLLAKTYVAAAIANAYPVGRGIGPVNHLYRMDEKPRVKRVGDSEH